MALRASWDGFLRLSMISVPVKAFPAATSSRDKIGFNQIHAECHSRIKYKKTCPIHGEVPNEEIVPGYEVAKGQYVLLDRADLANLKDNADRAINLDRFVRPGAIDPVYFGERSYYLAPDGQAGIKPYAVLLQAMAETERHAVGTMILSGKEHVVLLRPVGKVLAVTLLHYADEIKSPATVADEVPAAEVSADEVRLAEKLMEAFTTEEFDLAKYKDEYAGKVRELIEAKGKGKKVAVNHGHDEPAIINLMDALKRSLEQAPDGTNEHADAAGHAKKRPMHPTRSRSKHLPVKASASRRTRAHQKTG